MISISGDPLLLRSPLRPGHHAARMEIAMTQHQVPQRAAVVDRLGAVGARERPFRGREGRGEAVKNAGFTVSPRKKVELTMENVDFILI